MKERLSIVLGRQKDRPVDLESLQKLPVSPETAVQLIQTYLATRVTLTDEVAYDRTNFKLMLVPLGRRAASGLPPGAFNRTTQ